MSLLLIIALFAGFLHLRVDSSPSQKRRAAQVARAVVGLLVGARAVLRAIVLWPLLQSVPGIWRLQVPICTDDVPVPIPGRTPSPSGWMLSKEDHLDWSPRPLAVHLACCESRAGVSQACSPAAGGKGVVKRCPECPPTSTLGLLQVTHWP